MSKRVPDHLKKIAAKGATETFLRKTLSCNDEDCILWPYGKNANGYGLAVINGKQMPASRWMCILANGPAPSDHHEAAHSCGVPACINPKHLSWKTRAENQADRLVHGTHNLGERNGKTNLTEKDIHAIRSAPPDLISLMRKYGITKGCISKIRSGIRWAHVGAKHDVKFGVDEAKKAVK